MAFEIVRVGSEVDVNGTSLVGYIRAEYSELLACFKEDRGPSGDGKTRFEFAVEFFDVNCDDYVIAAIYDWKVGGVDRDDILVWNIGGNDSRALAYVQDVLHKHRFPDYKPSEDDRHENSI